MAIKYSGMVQVGPRRLTVELTEDATEDELWELHRLLLASFPSTFSERAKAAEEAIETGFKWGTPGILVSRDRK